MSLRHLLKRSSPLTTYFPSPLGASRGHNIFHLPTNFPLLTQLSKIHQDCSLSDGGQRKSTNKRIRMVPNSPWAVVDADETMKLLFFVGDKLFYPVRTPISYLCEVTRCYGSSFGWLIMGNSYLTEKEIPLTLFLVNTLNDQLIHLPPLGRSPYALDEVKVVLSSDPNHDDRALVAVKDDQGLACLHRLGDQGWTMGWDFINDCYDITFYKGVLYAVNYRWPKTFTIVFGEEDGRLHQRPFPLLHEKPRGDIYFLLESEGELLYVSKCTRHCHRCKSLYDGDSVRFCVFKLDFDTRSWMLLRSLGDRMLLLDTACSLSVDATKFSQFGFKPNCIYYTQDNNYRWHEFCLEDGKIVPFGDDFSTILPRSCCLDDSELRPCYDDSESDDSEIP